MKRIVSSPIFLFLRAYLASIQRFGPNLDLRLCQRERHPGGLWQERYLAAGIAGLGRDATQPGRKPPLSADTIQKAV